MFFFNKVLVIVNLLIFVTSGLSTAFENETVMSQSVLKNDTVYILKFIDAGRIALKNSPDIDIAKERILQAKEAYKIVMAGYYPDLAINCAAVNNRVSDVMHEKNKALASLSGGGIDNPEMSYNAGISMSWILFNGFGRKYNSAKRASAISMSQYGHSDSERVLLSVVSDAYFAAQLARENIYIAKADGVFYSRQLEDAEARNLAGTGTLSDVINFQVRVHSADAEIINAKYEYDAAMSALAALMGYHLAEFPVETTLAELEYTDVKNFKKPDVELFTNSALENRPDIRRFKHSLDMAASSIKADRADFFPIVWIEGGLSGSREVDVDFRNDDISNSVALNVTCNLFTGGADKAAVKRAKAFYRETERRFERLKIQIRSDIKQSCAELESALQQYALYKNNDSLVKQNRELVEMEYRAGKCSLVRLNEAQRDYTATRSRMTLAFVSTCQAKFRLDADTGNIRAMF